MDEAELIIPELIMLAGLIAIILIPKFGDASFRIPLTRIKIPVLIGGNRFKQTSNPKLPNQVSLFVFSAAFFSEKMRRSLCITIGIVRLVRMVMYRVDWRSLIILIINRMISVSYYPSLHLFNEMNTS